MPVCRVCRRRMRRARAAPSPRSSSAVTPVVIRHPAGSTQDQQFRAARRRHQLIVTSRTPSEVSFGHADAVPRHDRYPLGIELNCLLAARIDAADIGGVRIGAIGETARHGDRVLDRQPGAIRELPGVLHLAENVERPVAGDFDGDARAAHIAAAELARQSLLQLSRRSARGRDRADERKCDVARVAHLILAREIRLVEDGDLHLVARSELIRAARLELADRGQ